MAALVVGDRADERNVYDLWYISIRNGSLFRLILCSVKLD